MVLRKLLQLLMAHPRFGPMLVEKLSDSWPIRRAARFTAYLYLRGKQAIEENLTKSQTENLRNFPTNTSGFNLTRFKERLREEFRKGIEEAKRQKKL